MPLEDCQESGKDGGGSKWGGGRELRGRGEPGGPAGGKIHNGD